MGSRLVLAALPLTLWGCSSGGEAPALSKAAAEIQAPSPTGPRLGAAAAALPVYGRPGASEPLGHLRLGGQVARSDKALSKEGCAGGWFSIYPRGVVCADQGATLDLSHPAMAAPAPNLAAALPYAYVRTRSRAQVLELTTAGARAVGELMPRAGLAVLGASKAQGPKGKPLAVSILTDGRAIESAALEPAREVDFKGLELPDDKSLPVAFVVKDGVTPIRLAEGKVEVQGEIERGQVSITGKFHTRNNERYWALTDGSYLRNRDVTVIHRREKFPEFVRDDTRWVDVSTVACTLVAYEGKRPVFATLVDTGADRTGGPQSTQLGTFTINAKYTLAPPGSATFDAQAEIRDVPWAMKLSSGQFLAGSYWVSRFGILHGTGQVLLSPADARWLWRWVGGEVPDGWLGADIPEEKRISVVIRK